VEHAHLDLGVELGEPAQLGMLARHELLAQGRQLDEHVVLG
jgi:hypothetical protein